MNLHQPCAPPGRGWFGRIDRWVRRSRWSRLPTGYFLPSLRDGSTSLRSNHRTFTRCLPPGVADLIRTWCRVSALQGRAIVAQGNALGSATKQDAALKGRNKSGRFGPPFQGLENLGRLTQGVALGYDVPAFQAVRNFCAANLRPWRHVAVGLIKVAPHRFVQHRWFRPEGQEWWQILPGSFALGVGRVVLTVGRGVIGFGG